MRKIFLLVVIIALLLANLSCSNNSDNKKTQTKNKISYASAKDYLKNKMTLCNQMKNEVDSLEIIRTINAQDYSENGDSLILLYTVYLDYSKRFSKIKPSKEMVQENKVIVKKLKELSKTSKAYGNAYKKAKSLNDLNLKKFEKNYNSSKINNYNFCK